MAKEADNNSYKTAADCKGEIRIADDVVASIAGIAALEVDGVASIVGNITNDVISKVGRRALSKGVAVEVEDSVVSVRMALIMDYGFNIPVTSKKVQERVRNSIESMTGLKVSDVSVRIAGIDTSRQE
ncbi:MAG TPA: Asp23/Gls24 family envelope stress response protein [Lachnospiraceae bacterium]|nr:Asp23/Gls24 family envelope stress response protein [Lachnospiraceae bacterium]